MDGIIVPIENKLCADEITRILNDKNLQNKLVSECKKRDYSNREEVKKIYSIIDRT